jgi:hypothetical protein
MHTSLTSHPWRPLALKFIFVSPPDSSIAANAVTVPHHLLVGYHASVTFYETAEHHTGHDEESEPQSSDIAVMQFTGRKISLHAKLNG